MALIKEKTKPVRVLIVDDEESILELYTRILNPSTVNYKSNIKNKISFSRSINPHAQLSISLCNTGEDAVEEIRRSLDSPYSLVFLDIHLASSQNGIWTAERIREIDPDVEIVLVTGDTGINITEIAEAIPPKGKLFYLNKPFRALEIQQFTNSLSAKWIMEKQLRNIQSTLEDMVKERTSELLNVNKKLLDEINIRKKAESSLRQSEDNFKKMITHNADSIIIIDHKGNIQFANPASITLFKTDKENLISTKFDYPLVPDSTSEISLENKNGENLIIEMRVVDTEWHGKKAYLASLRDITEHKHLESDLQKSLKKIQIAMKGTVQVVARLLEMKDPYTAEHQRRVSELAYSLAKEMDLDKHNLEGIQMASLIHDIGKISIPSEILSKPGRLSDLEYDLIKTHPETGFEIVKEIEFPWPVAEIIHQHHERIDGSGYPRGLKGDAILLLAKILTVADVVEAISSHRPYRAALGIKKSLEHIEKNRKILYDPDVVDKCLKLFKRNHFEFKTKVMISREPSDVLRFPSIP